MKCATCDVYIEPSYHPCPQCKRRAGYTFIEDRSRCSDIYDLAFTILDGDKLTHESIVQFDMQKIFEQNWWIAAAEGSLSASQIEGLAEICVEKRIEQLIAVLPDEKPAGKGAEEHFGADEREHIGLAFVETNEDALRNFSWDFPLSFVLFPPGMEFLLCQYSHPAILAAGPKLLAERVFNQSIEDSIEQFKNDMADSDGTTLAAFLIENIIEPANSSAAK